MKIVMFHKEMKDKQDKQGVLQGILSFERKFFNKSRYDGLTKIQIKYIIENMPVKLFSLMQRCEEQSLSIPVDSMSKFQLVQLMERIEELYIILDIAIAQANEEALAASKEIDSPTIDSSNLNLPPIEIKTTKFRSRRISLSALEISPRQTRRVQSTFFNDDVNTELEPGESSSRRSSI